ncbi:MAG: hypothetical protein K2X77_33550 [Candidatus Obscuribacterales bacterium]|nr:hypothetical protein [Candidatus Obscuribacterales bacterium]
MAFWISSLLFWSVLCYVGLSFIEYFLHGTFMHQPNWLSEKSPFMKEVLDEHRQFHHADCFPAKHFDDREGECLEVNIRLRLLFGQVASSWIWGNLFLAAYRLGLDSRGGQFLAMGGVMFMLSLLAHHQAWNMIHVQMHTSPEKRASWFKNSSLCLWLARYHYMHHAHPKVNFCIVCPGADWLMGTYSQPSELDVKNMQKHGFYPLTA